MLQFHLLPVCELTTEARDISKKGGKRHVHCPYDKMQWPGNSAYDRMEALTVRKKNNRGVVMVNGWFISHIIIQVWFYGFYRII